MIADKKVVASGTIPELKKLNHPWIQEYFNGPRGRAAANFKPEDEAGADAEAPKSVEERADALSQDATEKSARKTTPKGAS